MRIVHPEHAVPATGLPGAGDGTLTHRVGDSARNVRHNGHMRTRRAAVAMGGDPPRRTLGTLSRTVTPVVAPHGRALFRRSV
jgi:hypothetical protein